MAHSCQPNYLTVPPALRHTPLMGSFGGNLRAIRLRLRLSQKELAARLGHTDNSTISLWERRALPPTPDTVARLARALDVPRAELLAHVPTGYEEQDPITTLVNRLQHLSQAQLEQLIAIAEHSISSPTPPPKPKDPEV